MNKTAKKTDQFDAALLVPAIVIGICYGIFLSIKGLPGGAELKAKRRAHEDARAAAVNPAEVQRLNAERDALKDKVTDKTKELDQARREGETLARKESKPQGRIDVV